MHDIVQNVDGSTRFINPTNLAEAARLNDAALEFYGVTFTATAEAAAVADRIDVTIQLTDRAGNSLAKAILLIVWAAPADSTGVATSTTQTTLTGNDLWVMGTAATLAHARELTAAGSLSVGFTVAGAGTRQICVIMPDGRLIFSSTLTWA